MDERIKGLKVKEVACDEIWGYVGMKARTKSNKKITDKKTGDAWCFIGMERYTKLILAWYLGHRNMDDTIALLAVSLGLVWIGAAAVVSNV
jgi:IS1 family transposase